MVWDMAERSMTESSNLVKHFGLRRQSGTATAHSYGMGRSNIHHAVSQKRVVLRLASNSGFQPPVCYLRTGCNVHRMIGRVGERRATSVKPARRNAVASPV